MDSRSDIRFQRRLDDAAVYWDENGRPEGNLWRPPDLNLLSDYYQRASDDMTPLQVEFFEVSTYAEYARKKAAEKAEKEREQKKLAQLFVGVLSTGLVLTTGSTFFGVVQLQQAQRQRAELLAATAKLQLSSEPVEAQVNAIASIGLDRSAFVNFPNRPLSASIQGSLSDVIQVHKEQNQLGHTAEVNSVAFSPAGKQIVSGSSDKTVRLWNATTGNPIGQPLTEHTAEVNSVAFSPDGKQIVSGSGDKTLRLWNVSWESLLQTACNQLRHHPILDKSASGVAKEATETCQQYVWSRQTK